MPKRKLDLKKRWLWKSIKEGNGWNWFNKDIERDKVIVHSKDFELIKRFQSKTKRRK